MNTQIKMVEEVITPAQAKTYLEVCNKNNRPVNQNRVNYYARQMKEGYWQVNGETISFDTNNVLTNGQHRLHAVVQANVPVTFLVVRGVDPKAFTTIDDVHARKNADVFYLCDILNYSNVSSVVRKFNILCTTATAICAGHTRAAGGAKLSSQEMLALYNSNAEVFQEATTMANSLYRCQRLYGLAEVGAFISYLHLVKGHDITVIFRFFQMLFQLNTTETTTACDKLRSMITKSALSNKKLTGSYKQKLLIKAWNDYLDGGKLKSLSVKEGETLTFK